MRLLSENVLVRKIESMYFQETVMPYRVSESVIEQRKVELDHIIQAPNNIAAFQSNDPWRLAYLIREAIQAAKLLAVEPYASLSIRLSVDPPHIYITPKKQLLSTPIPVDIQDLASEISALVIIPDAKTPFDVITAAMQRLDAPELHFPGYSGELAPIESWASKRSYKLDPQEGVFILRRDDD